MTPYRRRNYKLVKSKHGYDRVMDAGRAPMRRREQEGQIAIFNDLRPLMTAQKGKHFLAFAIPNGGYRTPREGQILKAMGVFPGVADVVVLLPPMLMGPAGETKWEGHPSRAIFIELKAIDPPPQPRFKKNGEPYKTRIRKANAGQERSQADFERLVTGLGFNYHLVAFHDPRDAVENFRAVMRSYGVNGF